MTFKPSSLLTFGLATALAGAVSTVSASPTLAQEAQSTKERMENEKAQRKKDEEFNRDVEFRQVVGPDVLPLGPYTVSLFVNGQSVEGRVRVAVQATSTAAKTAMETEKWAINGIVYPLAVRMYETGRPTREDIRLFKIDTQTRLSTRYPDMVEGVYIESIL